MSNGDDQQQKTQAPDAYGADLLRGDAAGLALVSEAEAGERLDRFLAAKLSGVSRTRLKALIQSGHVLQLAEEAAEAAGLAIAPDAAEQPDGLTLAVVAAAGGKAVLDAGTKVKAGQSYFVDLPEPEAAAPVAENMPLAVIYEDEDLIVIDKPPGLVVHPAPGHSRGTLVNGLLHHCGDSLSGIGGVRRPGIVHRLDKDTSGLLVVAKNDAAHQGLTAQFQVHGRDGRLSRRYLALVWGIPSSPMGVVDVPLGRSTANRLKIAVRREGQGREAVTRYKVLERFTTVDGNPLAALVECELETGRTHQIRVHMAHLRHPVLGDAIYGAGFAASRNNLSEGQRAALRQLDRQALHAAHLGFEHPLSGKALSFDAAPPEDMAMLIKAMSRTA